MHLFNDGFGQGVGFPSTEIFHESLFFKFHEGGGYYVGFDGGGGFGNGNFESFGLSDGSGYGDGDSYGDGDNSNATKNYMYELILFKNL